MHAPLQQLELSEHGAPQQGLRLACVDRRLRLPAAPLPALGGLHRRRRPSQPRLRALLEPLPQPVPPRRRPMCVQPAGLAPQLALQAADLGRQLRHAGPRRLQQVVLLLLQLGSHALRQLRVARVCVQLAQKLCSVDLNEAPRLPGRSVRGDALYLLLHHAGVAEGRLDAVLPDAVRHLSRGDGLLPGAPALVWDQRGRS
mmetsp:Transcript_39436/g.99954  ORF Transcript_39436/g.99954 Transcript_39436/m.99954 type:complete len:200 (-) Transcript_39436:9-608(-)